MSQPPTPAFDVFLSHNNRDKTAVRQLRDHLAARGLAVWFDEDELRPGIPWQQLLEDGIRDSRSVVVVVGSDGVGPWEDEEMRAALTLAVKDKRAVIPVLLPAAAKPTLPMFLQNRTWVDLAAGIADEPSLDRLVWGITGTKRNQKSRPPARHTPPPETRRSSAKPTAAPPPIPLPVAHTLEALLPGAWQVRIQTPFALGTLQLVLTPEGSFRGELLTPLGQSIVEGQWQANTPARQITLQGRQAAGFQVMPYYAAVQVTFFDAQQIVGITAAGEQVTWHKQTPAA
jgi:hypothetical protein